jgi:seryl-tRNA synthetase
MGNAMQNSELTLSKFDSEKENEILREEIELLKQENASLKKQVSNLQSSSNNNLKQSQDERDAIIFYLETVGNRMSGIPAMVVLIREFISDVISNIKSAEHLNVENYKRNSKRR